MQSQKPYKITYVYGRNKNNKYSYALNNPIRFTDPSGNDPYWVWENGQYVRKYENTAQRERIKKQREWNMNNAPDGKPTSETDFFKKMDRWMIRLENNISRLIESMFRKEEQSKIITINGEKMVRVIDKATSLDQIIPLSNYNPEIQTALEIIHKEVEFKLLQLREKPHLGSTRNGENAQSSGGDGDNWLSNARTAAGLTVDWFLGTGSKNYTFVNSPAANAMRNSPGVVQARNDYYKTGKTSGGYNFGLKGLMNAGIDPIEQFVGSYNYTISVVGSNLQFTLINTTSFSSAAYHLWPSSWNWNSGPMGNTTQTYIFTEPLLQINK